MLLFSAAACAVLILDIITKLIVSGNMELGSSIELISGVLELSYIRNTGAAWGILAGKQTLLQIFTALLMAGLAYYAIRNRKTLTRLEMISLGLVFGGGLGNFLSRVIRGYVVDFLNIHIIPVFNAADIGITVGCFLLILSTLLAAKKDEKDGL